MKVIVSVLTLIFCVLVFVALNPRLRGQVQEMNPFKEASRDVLAVLEGKVGGRNMSFYKLRMNQGVLVEVYTEDHSEKNLLQKIELQQVKDGIVEVQSTPTRMILSDFDQDGELELLVPVFDTQMKPLLYVFKYNSQSQKFDQVSP